MTSDPLQYELSVAPTRTIRGSIHLPEKSAWPAPVVLLCHGFKGFKDWGPWPWFATQLAARGFICNRFNFSMCGVGPALDRHDEPEKFSRNTYGVEIEDLAVVLEREAEWGLPTGAAGTGRGVVGHSRGGLVALLAGGENDAIDVIVTLASPGKSRRHTDEQVVVWRERGTIDIPNLRTGEVLQLDISVLDDFFAQETRYDLSRQIGRRPVPTMVVHGDADTSVSVDEAEWIIEALEHGEKERVILFGEGHTFGAKHPFKEPGEGIRTVLEHTERWLKQELRAKS